MFEEIGLSEQDRKFVGIGAAFGIIVGSVIFALTDSPLWLAFGFIFGVMAGAAFGYTKKQRS